MRCLVFVIGLLAASTNAQQATAYPYGFGCGGPARPFESVLSYTGVPRLGSTFSVNYQAPTFSGGGVTTFARLYSGLSHRSWAGMSLPIWIPTLGIGGLSSAVHCMIWTSLDIDMGLAFGNPRGQMNFTVPMQPSLIGVQIYQQWFLTTLVNAGGTIDQYWFWTNGGELTIGL